MKVREAVEMANIMKPNAFDDALKVFWLSQLEGKIAADIFELAQEDLIQARYTPEDMETEMLVQYPHDDIYVQWLAAKIDEANGEYNKYENQMAIYNSYYANFSRWFQQNYEPANGYLEGRYGKGIHKEDSPYWLPNIVKDLKQRVQNLEKLLEERQ